MPQSWSAGTMPPHPAAHRARRPPRGHLRSGLTRGGAGPPRGRARAGQAAPGHAMPLGGAVGASLAERFHGVDRPGRPRRPARRGRGEPAEAPRGDPGHQPDGRRDLPPRLPAAQLAARRRRRHLRLRAHATRRPGPRLRPARIPTLARPHTCAPPSSTATDAPSTTPNAASWSAFGAIEAATAWSRATRRTATALSAHGRTVLSRRSPDQTAQRWLTPLEIPLPAARAAPDQRFPPTGRGYRLRRSHRLPPRPHLVQADTTVIGVDRRDPSSDPACRRQPRRAAGARQEYHHVTADLLHCAIEPLLSRRRHRLPPRAGIPGYGPPGDRSSATTSRPTCWPPTASSKPPPGSASPAGRRLLVQRLRTDRRRREPRDRPPAPPRTP